MLSISEVAPRLGIPARRWRPDLSPLQGAALVLPFILLTGFFLAYPFVHLVKIAFGEPDGIGNFTQYFESGVNLRVLRITFVDAAIVTVIVVTVGACIAWTLRTSERRLTKLILLAAIFVPSWMGGVVQLYAFTVLLERLGVVNRVLLELHIVDSPLKLLYNQIAVVIGMVYQILPYSVLPLYVGFRVVDPELVRAAEGLGASRLRALTSIALPLALPGILATTVMVYVVSTGFFLTPVVLGGGTSPFAASLMYSDIFNFYDITGAVVSATVVVVAATVLITIGLIAVGRRRLRGGVV